MAEEKLVKTSWRESEEPKILPRHIQAALKKLASDWAEKNPFYCSAQSKDSKSTAVLCV